MAGPEMSHRWLYFAQRSGGYLSPGGEYIPDRRYCAGCGLAEIYAGDGQWVYDAAWQGVVNGSTEKGQ